MRVRQLVPILLFLCALSCTAQESYSRLNTFSSFFEYSNDSSRIILGSSENRKIGALGFQYQRRLVHRRFLDFSYTAEARPAMLESDPTQAFRNMETEPIQFTLQTSYLPLSAHCRVGSNPYNFIQQQPSGPPVTSTGTDTVLCGRRTVIEQGFSPVGIRISLMPHRRLQATLSTFGGYMFSTQPVPIAQAGSFNFTFEFGAGLEWFPDRSSKRSVRLEYQVQHFSNKYTASENPGVDNGFVKLTYASGR